jgi:hypothetical protein
VTHGAFTFTVGLGLMDDSLPAPTTWRVFTDYERGVNGLRNLLRRPSTSDWAYVAGALESVLRSEPTLQVSADVEG